MLPKDICFICPLFTALQESRKGQLQILDLHTSEWKEIDDGVVDILRSDIDNSSGDMDESNGKTIDGSDGTETTGEATTDP